MSISISLIESTQVEADIMYQVFYKMEYEAEIVSAIAVQTAAIADVSAALATVTNPQVCLSGQNSNLNIVNCFPFCHLIIFDTECFGFHGKLWILGNVERCGRPEISCQ